jgi:hypothetical protein
MYLKIEGKLIILNDVAQLESETVYPKGQTDPDN